MAGVELYRYLSTVFRDSELVWDVTSDNISKRWAKGSNGQPRLKTTAPGRSRPQVFIAMLLRLRLGKLSFCLCDKLSLHLRLILHKGFLRLKKKFANSCSSLSVGASGTQPGFYIFVSVPGPYNIVNA